MACCAFAVFVLMQVAAPFVWFWERTFGRNKVAENTAVTWSFADVAVVSNGRSRVSARPLHKGLVVAIAFELIVVAAAVQLSVRAEASAEDWAWAEALHDSWCRASARG